MISVGMCGNGVLAGRDGVRAPWALEGDVLLDDAGSVETDGFGSFMWGDREPFRRDPELWNLDPGSEPPLLHAYHTIRAIGDGSAAPSLLPDFDRVLFSSPGSW